MAVVQSLPQQRRRRGRNPLTAPLALFVAVLAIAVAYIGYVLWPRWPEAPITGDAPALPIVVADERFVIEPPAIRIPVQRRAGMQDRVDLAYRWPGLIPASRLSDARPSQQGLPPERLFVTIQAAHGALAPLERVETIYPRYLVPEPAEGPAGLTLRGFRDDTPYKGEELAFDADAPERFLARCTRHGVIGAGHCLLERRIGDVGLTFRFSRNLLDRWRQLAGDIDALIERLHPKP